jgi:hypothetical protein
MVEEAEKKLRWVETILSVMDLVIPGMFRNSRKLPAPSWQKIRPPKSKEDLSKSVYNRINLQLNCSPERSQKSLK